MSKEEELMLITGTTLRKCWNCGKDTYNVSISFETPMCSEKCDDVKYKEYLEEISKYDGDELL